MMFSPAVILLVSFSSLASAQTCGDFAIAGSSTVKPVAEAFSASYADVCPSAVITIEGGGSSNGAGRVCADTSRGEPVEIGNMSRGWKDSEAVADDPPYLYKCLQGDTSRSAFQIDVAIDGLSVATKAGGAGDLCIQSLGGLTTDQLRWMFTNYNDTALEASGWDPASLANSDGDETTHLWSELSADCPEVEVKIAGADDQSGTYEYFLETILSDYDNGESFGHGDEYFDSAVDEDLIMYLEENEDAIAYFGYAYYYSNADVLSAAAVMNSAGEYVAPTPETVGDGSYNPLARRIYMNLLNDPAALEVTVPYVEHGFSDDSLVAGTGYVPLSEEEKAEMIGRVKL